MDPSRIWNNAQFQSFLNEEVERDIERRRRLGNQFIDFLAQNPPPSTQTTPIPMHTSVLTGMNWVSELINGHHKHMHNQLRMKPPVFSALCKLLHENYGLRDRKHISHIESLAIFLYVCAHGVGYRQALERFQYSLDTISHVFHIVLDVMEPFVYDQIKGDVNAEVHPYIRNNDYYYPHFKDCIGATDGTHVSACVGRAIAVPFIGRSEKPIQNVLGLCDFDMCFTYVSAGWEGSMHDTRVLDNVMHASNFNFPTPPAGKYYLVDSGYPNITGFLAPYKNERYHLSTFENGNDPTTANEIFNRAHASLRSTIERTFGVWKNRWHIIDRMSFTDVTVQARIIATTMALHNYIRRMDHNDPVFRVRLQGQNINEDEEDLCVPIHT